MTDTHDHHSSGEQENPEPEERPKKKDERALELGEQAEHSIGPRREHLIEKAKQESP